MHTMNILYIIQPPHSSDGTTHDNIWLNNTIVAVNTGTTTK